MKKKKIVKEKRSLRCLENERKIETVKEKISKVRT